MYDGIIGPWFLGEFAAAAAVDSLNYAVLLPPVERCVARVTGRTGHAFTDEGATRHMHQQFAQAGVGNRHVLDLVVSPEQTVQEILNRLDAGTLRYP